MIRSFKYRLYTSQKVSNKLDNYLENCRRLYNKLLYLEKITYQLDEKFIFYNDLAKIIKTEKNIYSQVKQKIAKNLDTNLKKFFKGRKDGVGFPRFKRKDHCKSFTYPQSGFKLENEYLTLSGFSKIKVKEHRQIPKDCKIKTCTIKKEIDFWYVIFTIEFPDKEVKRNDFKEIGIDLGCKDFITLSDGSKVENPKYLKNSINLISKFQNEKELLKNPRKKNKLSRKISKLHQKVFRQREDFQHKLSRKLVIEYSHIYIEDLKINKMIKDSNEKKNLRKTILDSGWNSFTQKLSYKVEETGTRLVKVNPKNTTKMCSNCGLLVPKELSERIHKCSCGLILDRDINAALNILSLGKRTLDANVS